jgi:hypothetical protein
VKMQCLLVDRFGFAVDWMVTCAHQGKNLVDALAGRDKFDLRNGYIWGIDSAQRDANGKQLRETAKACNILNDPARGEGDYKHKKTAGGKHLKSRLYDPTDYESKWEIPAQNCKYQITSGFSSGAKGTAQAKQNGVHEMHHFR